jgi:RHS repeat-associated protein
VPPTKTKTGVPPKNASPKQAPSISTPATPTCVNYTVAGGVAQSAAVQSPGGTPMGWGADYLQVAPTTNQFGDYIPRSVPGPANAVAVSSLGYDTLILINGTVWGYGLSNQGQLGVGGASNVATQVVGINGVVAISAGVLHSLVLRSDGTVWGWGDDTYGELGVPPSPPNNRSLVPVQVAFNFPAPVVQISAGNGTSLALDSTGTLWWWGTALTGPLSVNPTPAVVPFAGNPKIVLVTLGLAVDSSGNLWSWGGYPGNGTSTPNTSPAIVPGLSGIAAIAEGSNWSLAADSSGRVWAWGDNTYGQLGIGNFTTPQLSPVQILSLSGPVALAAGDAHSFALFSGGALYGWGQSSNGQVGTGFVTNYDTPQLIGITVAPPAACAGGPASGTGPNPGPTTSETLGGKPRDEIAVSCDGGNYPVNCVTGNFWHQFNDLTIPGRGPFINFQRTYNSLGAAQQTRLGFGWTDSYNVSLSFDGAGNPTVHEENGGTLPFTLSGTTYTSPSRVLASLVKNADGTFTLSRRDKSQLTFSSAGLLQKETDRNSYTTLLSYNSGNQLTTITDPGGRKLTLSYNVAGQLATLADPASRSVSYGYDSAGNLLSVTDVNSKVTSFTYDTNHLLLTIVDPRNGVLSNVYDTSGRVTQQTDPTNHVIQFGYGTGSTTITYPNGDRVMAKLQNNAVATQVNAYGTGLATSRAFAYDNTTMGLATLTDPLGNQTKATWDSSGNLLSSTDPLNHTTTYIYNSFNEVLTQTDALHVTTTNTYDAFGNRTSTSTPLVGTMSSAQIAYTYDPAHSGDLIKLTDADGQIWQYSYDSYGNRIKSTDPLGDTTTYTYDVVGRITSSVSPNGNITGGNLSQYTTTRTFDGFGNVLTVTNPMNEVTTYTYDANENVSSVKDANLHTTTFTYDADNRQTQVTRADQSVLKTGYDADGNVVSQSDGLNNTTTYTYDAQGNKVSVADGLGRALLYGYGSPGYLTSEYDPLGRVTSYSYDVAGRIASVTYSDAKTPNVSYGYDADNQRISMSDGSAASSYTFDSLHRLTQQIDGAGAQVKYAYDLNGQATTVTYPGGVNTVTRTYDAAGRLASVTDWKANTTRFNYDADSNLITWTYPNSVVGNWAYNRADKLSAINYTAGTKHTVFLSFTYTRDADTQLTAENSQTYGYDTVNRVNSAPPNVYVYDNADQLTQVAVSGGNTTTLAYDAANELLTNTVMNGTSQVQKYTYTYNNDGNRVKRVDQINNTTTMAYDQADRLTAFGSAATYTYDGSGLRTSKTVSGSKTVLTWDLAEGIPFVIGDGTTSYVTGPKGLPLEQVAGKSVAFYHVDQIDSVRAITDSRGATLNTYNYDLYGNLSSSTGTLSNPFRYAAQYYDSESGFYYLRARYYDPATESFLTRDPTAQTTQQPYSYAHDSPVNSSDPTGLDSTECQSLLNDILKHAERAWNAAQAAIHDEVWRGDCKKAAGHWQKYDEAMISLNRAVNRYLDAKCDPRLIPGWVQRLRGGELPGIDDLPPWVAFSPSFSTITAPRIPNLGGPTNLPPKFYNPNSPASGLPTLQPGSPWLPIGNL